MKTLVFCNGENKECSKTQCYKNGGECRHTTNTAYALNQKENRRFIKSVYGDNFEIDHN